MQAWIALSTFPPPYLEPASPIADNCDGDVDDHVVVVVASTGWTCFMNYGNVVQKLLGRMLIKCGWVSTHIVGL